MADLFSYEKEDAIRRWTNVAKRYRLLMELNHSIDTAQLRRKSQLLLEWSGDRSYTSSADYIVRVGVRGYIDMNLKYLKTDEDLLNCLEFVRHHEVLHLYYTGGDSWQAAIRAGTRTVLEQIASERAGRPVRFRNEQDEKRIRKELSDELHGVDVCSLIDHTSRSICNCMEDGRIERIGSSAPVPGTVYPPFCGELFADARLVIRGRNFYEYESWKLMPWEEIKDNATYILHTLIDQILLLSKCQVYQKGFLSVYGDTPMMDLMERIEDYIRIGYMGKTTAALIEANTGICRELAPYIFEAAKEAAENMAALEEFMALLRQLIKIVKSEHAPANSDSDAHEDPSGESNSALPSNDLDEKDPDGAQQQSSGQSNQSSGKDEESGESGSSENAGGEEGAQQQSSGQPNQSSDKDGESGESGSSENADGKSGTKTIDDDGEGSGSGDDLSSDSEDMNSPAAQKNGRDKPPGQAGEDELQKAIEEAAEKLKAYSAEDVQNVNRAMQAGAEQRRSDEKKQSRTIRPVTQKDVMDLCDHFYEVRREYEVSENLPSVQMQDGRTFRNWFEKFLKSKKAPTVRYRRSGKLDRCAISNLAKKDTRVFKKESKSAFRKCCVYILVDNSGSMGGAKRAFACQSAGVIEEGIKYTVPTKIVAFDETSKGVRHYVVKDWDEVFTNNCCYSFERFGPIGSGNDDGYDIEIAAREILQRPEERKILIVLSDGAPADTGHVRSAIEEARSKGIKVCGIYFENGSSYSSYHSDTFVWMYQKDYVCCAASEIQKNLLAIVERFLKG